MQLALTEVVQLVPPHIAASLVPKSRNALQLPSHVHAEHVAGAASGASPASNAVSENAPVQWIASAAVRNATGPCQPLGAASTQRTSLQSSSAQSTLPSPSSSSPLSQRSAAA